MKSNSLSLSLFHGEKEEFIGNACIHEHGKSSVFHLLKLEPATTIRETVSR